MYMLLYIYIFKVAKTRKGDYGLKKCKLKLTPELFDFFFRGKRPTEMI